MPKSSLFSPTGILFIISLVFLVATSVFVLSSISENIFPLYYIYFLIAFILFYLLSKVDFEVFTIFSKYFYIMSIILLILPLILGQVTRGTIRWIPIGSIRIQPSELVRPFLLLYFANYITSKEINIKRLIKAFLLMLLPVLLIVVQPSLGVAVLTATGFMGVMLASSINKKYVLISILIMSLMAPIFFLLLAPYQKDRVVSFLNPEKDPYGSGYNSIQSMIAVGSGELTGRGLGEGTQTQLAFLPEKHTDFIFAAIAEELGFVGAVVILIGLFGILWSLIIIIENSANPGARAFVSGIFLVLLVEVIIHVGMNMGLLPITGIPLPFVSAGGSALIGTTMSLAIALKARKPD